MNKQEKIIKVIELIDNSLEEAKKVIELAKQGVEKIAEYEKEMDKLTSEVHKRYEEFLNKE